MTNTARRRRSMRIAGIAAIPAALLVSGALVGGASYSAFTATTSTPTNNWSAGTVALANDGQGAALFQATNLAPGATAKKDVTVTSTGSVASVVKLYGAQAATTKGLASYVDITVAEGTGTGASFTGTTIYTGTLADFGASHSNYSDGVVAWSPAGGGSDARTFEISYTLDASTPDSAQGGTAALAFTWEAQSK